MIQVDISNVWGELSLPDLLGLEKEVAAAHEAVDPGCDDFLGSLGWQKLPDKRSEQDLEKIRQAAERIRGESDVLVVIGTGGSYLGAKAAIELLQGPGRNLGRGKGAPMILYAGSSLSTRSAQRLAEQLDGKDFSIAIISKSGTTLEPALAARSLRWILGRRYGTDEARRRIYAVTDPCQGPLVQMAREEGWTLFPIPQDVSGRYSALSAAGLLPMAAAGLDIRQILEGAAEAKGAYSLRSFENPVWLYAAVRNLMHRGGKAAELLAAFEPGARAFGAWWQQLFAESEGKEGRGLLPLPAVYPTDLHSLGQMIQQGRHNLFETLLRFDPPERGVSIEPDWKNLDGLNYLEGRTLDAVEDCVYRGITSAHVDGGVPVIAMDCGPLSEEKVGELIFFMQLSCAVSAGVLGVNPFTQPGVEAYRREAQELLRQL